MVCELFHRQPWLTPQQNGQWAHVWRFSFKAVLCTTPLGKLAGGVDVVVIGLDAQETGAVAGLAAGAAAVSLCRAPAQDRTA